MFTIEWNEESLKKFYSKTENILSKIEKGSKKGVNDACANTQKAALDKKRGSKNKDMIPFNVISDNKYITTGRIYTDKKQFSYASFLEFGTGILAEREHIGKTKTFIESGYRYWYLPVEKANRTLNNPIVEIQGTLFYIMYSTQPFPFMRPAGFQERKNNVQIIKNKIKEEMRLGV